MNLNDAKCDHDDGNDDDDDDDDDDECKPAHKYVIDGDGFVMVLCRLIARDTHRHHRHRAPARTERKGNRKESAKGEWRCTSITEVRRAGDVHAPITTYSQGFTS